MLVRITDGGPVTYPLNDPTSYYQSNLISYRPEASEMDAETGIYANVAESAVTQIADEQRMLDFIAGVNRIASTIALRLANPMAHRPVLLGLTPRIGIAEWFAELLSLRAYLDSVYAPYRVRVEWVRRPFFENAAQSGIPFIGGGVTRTANLGPASGSGNMFRFDSGTFGDLRTPIEVHVRNTGTSSGVGDVFIAGYHDAFDSLWDGLLEGEGTTITINNPGSNQSDGTCSSGAYHTVSVPSIHDSWFAAYPDDPLHVVRMGWGLGTMIPSHFAGRTIKPIVRLRDVPDINIQIAFAVGYGNGYGAQWVVKTPWQNAYNDGSRRLIEGSAVRIPPALIEFASGQSVASGMCLAILARKMNPGSGTLNVDYVQLFPSDYFARLRLFTGSPVATNETVVARAGLQVGYVDNAAGTERRAAYTVEGQLPQVVHGRGLSLYVAWHTGDGSAAISSQVEISARIKQRKLTI